MSFYDSASLAFLPSGGAGKDGKAYSIKPVPEYGNELVTNGGFYTDSDWTKGTGWTISGGTANCDGTQTSTSQLKTSVGLSIQNTLVEFSFELKNYSAGTLTATIEGTGGNEFSNINSNGVYTIQATSSDLTPRIAFNADSSFIGSIDNVSVKEVIVDGDFTFSRGNNLSATRVDSNGLIEKGRENLLVNSVWDGVSTDTKPTGWSNQFVSGTGTFDVTATEGQIRFQTLDASSRAFIYSPTITTNGIVVASVYVDEVTTAIPLSNLLSRSANATDLFAYEDGVEINYSDNVQAGKRYSVVFNKTASTNFRFGVGVSSGTLGDVVLSRPQIEVGLVATEWITSPIGSTGKAGILEDSPRFDYSGGASCPSLLLEPSRTNVWKYTEYLSYSFSQIVATTITQNTTETLSPEGLYNATKLEGIGSWIFKDFLAGTDTGTWTISCWVKAVNPSSNNTFRLSVSGNNFSSNLTATSEWQRFYFSVTNGGATAAGLQRDTSANDADLYVYGLQVEEGSYITSYIPNHSGGSVTRNADYSESSTSLSIGDSEFCAYYEIDAEVIPRESSITFFRIEFGSNSNFIGIKGSSNSINNSYTLQTLGVYSETIGNIAEAGVVKFLINYSSGTGDFFINGTKYDAVISGPTTGNTINNVELRGSGYAHDSKQILLFPSALSNTDCEILTGTSYESFAAMATALNYTTYE